MSRTIHFVVGSKKRLTLVGVILVAVASAVAAVAYFLSTGLGTGIASTGHLNPPTSVGGVAAGSTVSVSWTASATGSDAVAPTGYYVTRDDGSTATAACGSSAMNLVTGSSCSDTSVPSGTYTYTVTAVYHSWTAVSAPSSSVTVAALDHFDVSAPSSATAGSPFSVTVTAKDASNNTITTYAGSVHFTSSDGQAVLPSDYTFTSGDNGSHAFSSGVTLKTAGSQTVSVNDTVQTTATGSASVTVSAAGAAKVVFTQQPSNSTGGVALATQPKLTVKDAFGNVVTGDSSTAGLSITSGTPSSGGPGTLSGCSQTESNGVITFSGCKIDKIGGGYKLHATDGT